MAERYGVLSEGRKYSWPRRTNDGNMTRWLIAGIPKLEAADDLCIDLKSAVVRDGGEAE